MAGAGMSDKHWHNRLRRRRAAAAGRLRPAPVRLLGGQLHRSEPDRGAHGRMPSAGGGVPAAGPDELAENAAAQ